MRQYRTPAERSAEIEPGGGFGELYRECLAEVVRWRAYRGGNCLHRPEPLLTEMHHEQAARWLDVDVDASSDEGLPEDAVRVGFDAHDRPVLARAVGAFPHRGKHQLLRYLDGYEEVVNTVRMDGTRKVVVVHLWRDEAGRVIETRDETGTRMSYRYEDDRLAVAQEERTSGKRWEYRCEYDAAGALARIASGREGATTSVEWDARLHRHEPDLPPARELIAALVSALTETLAAGIVATAARMPAPRCVLLRHGLDFPAPECVVVDAGALEGARRAGVPLLSSELNAFLRDCGDGVREVDVIEHAGPETLQMLRQLDQRSHVTLSDLLHGLAPAEERPHALVPELLRTCNEPAAGIGLPVLPWDHLAGHFDELAPAVPEREVARIPDRPPADRGELLRALPTAGLERVADAIAGDVRDAIMLVPDPGGRSQLGGVPALPVGTGWPHREPGRPLTPLAAIDCAQLPPAEGRELLPQDGTLLLFADLGVSADGDEEELGWGIRTPGDGWIAIVHVPAGARTELLEPPHELRDRQPGTGPGLLEAMPVTARPVPSLRDPESAAPLLGLDAGEHASYRRLAELVAEPRIGVAQLLGHPLPAQGDPRSEGQELLFDLPPVRGLGDEVIPGYGTLTFVAAREDLGALRWDCVQAVVATG